jgi:hypothetical protein
MQECWQCGHRLIGYGCTKDSRTHPIHVKDHDTCEKWVHKQTVGTINHEQDLYDDRLKGV